jgi:hypothetical protein
MKRRGSEVDRQRPLAATALVGLLATVVAVLVIGTACAIAGTFRWWLVLPLAVPAAAGLALLARPDPRPITTEDAGRAPSITVLAGVVVVIAIAFAVPQVARHSEHLLTDRDPGVYQETARWLAREGAIGVDVDADPFASGFGATLGASSLGFDDRRGDTIHPQFAHGWPVLLAAWSWATPDGWEFALPALLGAAALCTFAVLAARAMRAWIVIAVLVALAVAVPQWYFARDTYSEVPAELLALGAFLVLMDARDDLHAGRALLAGLLFGAGCLVRIDGYLLLAVLPPVLAADWLHHRGDPVAPGPPGRFRTYAVALIGGAAVPAALALADLALQSPRYGRAHRGQIVAMGLAVAASALLSLAAAACSRFPRIAVAARRLRPAAAVGAAGATLTAAAVLVGLRPYLHTPRARVANPIVEAAQVREGLGVDPFRTYAELSGRWFVWYLGPLVALGIAGAVWLAYAVVRGRARGWLPFFAGFALLALGYLWRPSITPDQPWAMRRYLPVVIPGVLLLAGMASEQLQRVGERRSRTLAQAATVALAALLATGIAWSAAVSARIYDARDQDGMVATVDRLCTLVGADGAAVTVRGGGVDLVLPQALRSRCDIAVAVAERGADPDCVAALAATHPARLVAIADTPDAVRAVAPGPAPTVELVNENPRLVEEVVSAAPDELVTETYRFFARPVVPARGAGGAACPE